jgi:hypothetical protein
MAKRMRHPSPGDRSPWGTIQNVSVIVPYHIYLIGTEGHGGMKLSPEYNALVDQVWRVKGGWYEEDVDVAIVIVTFQKVFADKVKTETGRSGIDAARDALVRHYPKQYSDWWPRERDLKALVGLGYYDAAEIAELTRKASADIDAMFGGPVQPRREKTPARIFRSEHDGLMRIQLAPGDMVVCDFCNKDWTDKPTSGGFIFSGYAVCPDCEPKQLKSIKGHGEEEEIEAFCPSNMSFADFVRSGR